MTCRLSASKVVSSWEATEMRSSLIVAVAVGILGFCSTQAEAQGYGYGTGSNPNGHYVNPYTTPGGTYVAPHYQSNPNPTPRDNWGTRGNVNPYTGQPGYR